jgi:hypothetical protein
LRPVTKRLTTSASSLSRLHASYSALCRDRGLNRYVGAWVGGCQTHGGNRGESSQGLPFISCVLQSRQFQANAKDIHLIIFWHIQKIKSTTYLIVINL